MDQSVLINIFSDDTTVESCIENEDEMAYRAEVQINTLELNVLMKKRIIDFQRKKTEINPLSINGMIIVKLNLADTWEQQCQTISVGCKHTVHHKKGTMHVLS